MRQVDRETLLKVQPVLLEIAREIKRVCDENGIRYFLYRGTFLGAVRHRGFIPWDDDMDFAMVREDYEKFRKIAPEKLGKNYCFQDWHTEERYPLPFGKVRKKNTVYFEAKSKRLEENGFYVDIYPLDYAPEDSRERKLLGRKQVHLERLLLMKSHYTPWQEEDRINYKKRLGYIPYQLLAALCSRKRLVETYDRISKGNTGNMLYENSGIAGVHYFQADWCRNLSLYSFEDDRFYGPLDYDSCLTQLYGDYMTLPPEDQRENRHQILEIDFGKEDSAG